MNQDPKINHPDTFKVGDTVEATDNIWRRDRKGFLRPGDQAKVLRVFRVSPSRPQIIDLEIGSGASIHDLVCFDDLPLKLLYPNRT